jgi:hypothetical protein
MLIWLIWLKDSCDVMWDKNKNSQKETIIFFLTDGDEWIKWLILKMGNLRNRW